MGRHIKPKQGDIVLVTMDPTIGREIKKTRPCLVISPDVINSKLSVLIIAPITNTLKQAPFRIEFTSNKVKGDIVLNQIKAIDKKRIIKHLDTIDKKLLNAVKDTLIAMFS